MYPLKIGNRFSTKIDIKFSMLWPIEWRRQSWWQYFCDFDFFWLYVIKLRHMNI